MDTILAEAIIWDMDGVLVNSEKYWLDKDDFFLAEYTQGWDTFDKSKLVGRSLDGIFDLLRDEVNLSLSKQAFLEGYQQMARSVYTEHAELMPAALEVLLYLKEKHVIQVLASSSPHRWINYALTRFNLRKYFRHVISSEDVGGEGKPSPAIYNYALNKLALPPEHIVVIEDSNAGITAGKNAGLYVIAFQPDSNAQNTERADLKITKLNQLMELIQPID